jgi:phosphoesterase RecJ-like protein
VNYALSIQDVEIAAFFREMPNGGYRVSLRSKGQLNVAAIAECFGGGGHECASGFAVEGPLTVAVARVIERLRAG